MAAGLGYLAADFERKGWRLMIKYTIDEIKNQIRIYSKMEDLLLNIKTRGVALSSRALTDIDKEIASADMNRQRAGRNALKKSKAYSAEINMSKRRHPGAKNNLEIWQELLIQKKKEVGV